MAVKPTVNRDVARNRRVRHDYDIEDTVEAGLMLVGSEVKSLRLGRASINEAYAGEDRGQLALFNAHIPEYRPAEPFNHEPKRVRKLLVHRKERDRLLGLTRRSGYTLIPMALYFNDRGLAKLQIGLAKGTRTVDKREDVKKRDWERQKARLLRDKG